MLTSTRFQIPYPNPATRADSADAPRDFAAVVTGIEKAAIYGQGVLASRPVSTAGSPGIQGRFYYATDTGILYYDTGTAWQQIGDPGAVPVGAVMDFPWSTSALPGLWAVPQGQALAKATYTVLNTLASASGYPHGSDAANLNAPDYRGRVSAGLDAGANRITIAVSGIAGATLGAVGGVEGVSLATGELPAHNHGVNDPTHAHSVYDPGHGHVIWRETHHLTPGGTPYALLGYGSMDWPTDNRGTGIGIYGSGTGITTGNTGSGIAHRNVQPTIMVNKIMRVS